MALQYQPEKLPGVSLQPLLQLAVAYFFGRRHADHARTTAPATSSPYATPTVPATCKARAEHTAKAVSGTRYGRSSNDFRPSIPR